MKKFFVATLMALVMVILPFAAIAQIAHSATVNWTMTSTTGVTKYNVYRSVTAGVQGALVGSTANGTTLNYKDSTVVVGTKYYFSVAAVNAMGEGPLSAEGAADFGLPGTPQNVTVTVI